MIILKFSLAKVKHNLAGYGLPILCSGYLLAWAFTSGSGDGSFTQLAFTMALGVLLIFLAPKRPSRSYRNNIAIYILPFFYFAIAIPAAAFAEDFSAFSYLVYGLLLYLAVLYTNIETLNIINSFRYFGLILSCIYILFNIEQLTSVQGIGIGRQRVSFDNEAYTLTAYGALVGAIAAAFAYVNGVGNRWLNALIMSLCLYIVLSTGTRSVYIGILFSIGLIILTGKRRQVLSVIGISALVGIVSVALFPILRLKIFAIFSDILAGFSTFAGGGGAEVEMSAMGRYLNRGLGIQNFLATPFLGAGYKTKWLDFPILQAFQDMGLFFGIIFALVFLIVPLGLVLRFYRRHSFEIDFITLLYLANMPRLFLHGQPYDWPMFAYSMPIYCCLFLPKNRSIGDFIKHV